VKIIVAGGFGAGKTTAIGALSEFPPLSTEAAITTAGSGLDDRGRRRRKARPSGSPATCTSTSSPAVRSRRACRSATDGRPAAEWGEHLTDAEYPE
jgi:hypothetical protein